MLTSCFFMMICRKVLLKSLWSQKHDQLHSVSGTKGYTTLKKIENSCITGLAVHQHANHSESGDVCDSLIIQTPGRQWWQKIRNQAVNIDISLNMMFQFIQLPLVPWNGETMYKRVVAIKYTNPKVKLMSCTLTGFFHLQCAAIQIPKN